MKVSKGVNQCLCLMHLWMIVVITYVIAKADGQPVFNVTEGKLNETINGLSHISSSQVYYYEITAEMIQNPRNTRFRVYSAVGPLALRTCPLLITVQGHRTILSWELPILGKNDDRTDFYFSTARTLCLNSTEQGEQTVSIMVTSCSTGYGIPFTVSLMLTEDLEVKLGQSVTTAISPTLPEFYRFYFPLETKRSLLVQVTSPDDICMTVSIQDLQCPVMDQESNIAFKGDWQTMSSKAGLTVRRSRFPEGFALVFLVLKEDTRCQEYFGLMPNPDSSSRSLPFDDLGPRAKNITFVIEEVIDTSQYVTPTLVPLALTFGLILIVFAIFSVFQNLKVITAAKLASSSESLPSSRPCITACQTPLRLQDLQKVTSKKLQSQSQRYFWTLLIIAIFYCVPVFQLITNYLKVVYRTGEQDICYYNYYCARPLGYVMDFNHIYSNVSYILFGLAFIIFVRIRSLSFIGEKDNGNEYKEPPGILRRIFPILDSTYDHGVLQHFGLFYAIGIALISEGLLSGAYHICPNQSNFQFDTSFMYIIAVLGLVKVYQFRHPIQISVNVIFIMAFVASSAVLGLLFNALAFKICFSIIYLLTILILLTYLYFVGFIRDANNHIATSWLEVYDAIFSLLFRSYWTEEYDSYKFRPHRSQLILPIGSLLFNVMLIILQWTALRETNFATQLLGIFVMNLFVYTFYYCIKKWIHGEYRGLLCLQSIIYAMAAAILWGFALYYFGSAMSSWSDSPAVSRTYNEFCVVADFYDNHDLWHFLSAAALFCSFMMLLTIDDDLLTVKHTRIPVF